MRCRWVLAVPGRGHCCPGLYSYGLHRHGLYSYGLHRHGVYGYGHGTRARPTAAAAPAAADSRTCTDQKESCGNPPQARGASCMRACAYARIRVPFVRAHACARAGSGSAKKKHSSRAPARVERPAPSRLYIGTADGMPIAGMGVPVLHYYQQKGFSELWKATTSKTLDE